MFDETLPGDFLQPVSWLPPVEVTENEKDLKITAELPGLAEKDIEVTFENDVLTISGEKKEEREEKNDRQYHMVERTYGSFRRSFTLPSNVDASKVVAEFKNGVLSIQLPKMAEEKAAKTRIPINPAK
jgi:HSP20 family protein